MAKTKGKQPTHQQFWDIVVDVATNEKDWEKFAKQVNEKLKEKKLREFKEDNNYRSLNTKLQILIAKVNEKYGTEDKPAITEGMLPKRPAAEVVKNPTIKETIASPEFFATLGKLTNPEKEPVENNEISILTAK